MLQCSSTSLVEFVKIGTQRVWMTKESPSDKPHQSMAENMIKWIQLLKEKENSYVGGKAQKSTDDKRIISFLRTT
jgi:hypothetical protein